MALLFRDVRTRVVRTMLEPSELIEQEMADGATRPHAEWLAMHQRKAIQKMDDARRWERVNEVPRASASPTPPPADDTPESTPRDVSERPAVNDPKTAWVAWAIHVHGYDPDEAETLTKEQLKEL